MYPYYAEYCFVERVDKLAGWRSGEDRGEEEAGEDIPGPVRISGEGLCREPGW